MAEGVVTLVSTPPPSLVAAWADRIRSHMARTVESIVAVGHELTAAKADLDHGEWLPLLTEVGLEASTAQRLMAVAGHTGIANAAHVQHLPPSWGTLYQLSRLPELELTAAIEAGEVRPDMERREAQALVRRHLGGPSERRLRSVGDEPAALPTGVFRTIVADPPWQYDNKATRGAATDHYSTMGLDDLCGLDVEKRSATDAHLYLWTTNGFMREAFDVLAAWGFTYKTLLTWVKPQIGMGNYFRSCTEHVLFGVRGSLRTGDRAARNWFEAARGPHSVKPDCFYDLVERCSPGPYLELFARRRRLGWDSWGHEA